MVICLEWGADLHMSQLMPLPLTISCFNKIQIGFTFGVPAHLGSPGKRAIKRVCVCYNRLGDVPQNDITLVLQQNRLCWYGHVLRKEDDDWANKCIEYEVEGPRPRGRPKRTWREVVKEDCLARNLDKEDAMDRSKWRKLIKDVRSSGPVWVGVYSGTGLPGQSWSNGR